MNGGHNSFIWWVAGVGVLFLLAELAFYAWSDWAVYRQPDGRFTPAQRRSQMLIALLFAAAFALSVWWNWPDIRDFYGL